MPVLSLLLGSFFVFIQRVEVINRCQLCGFHDLLGRIANVKLKIYLQSFNLCPFLVSSREIILFLFQSLDEEGRTHANVALYSLGLLLARRQYRLFDVKL